MDTLRLCRLYGTLGCLTLAAVRMADLCSQLEKSGANASRDAIADLINRIESEFSRVHPALVAIIAAPAV